MLVTHDVAEAISLADRVILIEGGRVALDEVVNIPRHAPAVAPASPHSKNVYSAACFNAGRLSRIIGKLAGESMARRSAAKDPR